MQKITPSLWFDGRAEEAMDFYVSIFKNSQIVGITRYGEVGPGVHVLAGPLICRELRDAGGSGRVLGAALRGRRKETMRLVSGQIRYVMADCSDGPDQDVE